VIDVVQGTDEWKRARAGLITASRVADVLTKTKSGPAASRKNYAAQLIVERITGTPQERGFVSAEMRWGTEHEPDARSMYELERDVSVEQVGFVIHDELEYCGASPDGLVGTTGAVEIKCPGTAQHLALFEGGKIDARYVAQMQWVMFVAGRQWCDFVSYDPRVEIPELVLYMQRIQRDEKWIENAIQEVVRFEAEIRTRVDRLKSIAEEVRNAHSRTAS
jgi:putative phage-type endonuclease